MFRKEHLFLSFFPWGYLIVLFLGLEDQCCRLLLCFVTYFSIQVSFCRRSFHQKIQYRYKMNKIFIGIIYLSIKFSSGSVFTLRETILFLFLILSVCLSACMCVCVYISQTFYLTSDVSLPLSLTSRDAYLKIQFIMAHLAFINSYIYIYILEIKIKNNIKK